MQPAGKTETTFQQPACALQDTAHAAASVHATVMSEEDAVSEGETHLSSRRAAASRSVPPRSAQDPGAYVEERQASHHTAGLRRPEPLQLVSSRSLLACYSGSKSMHLLGLLVSLLWT